MNWNWNISKRIGISLWIRIELTVSKHFTVNLKDFSCFCSIFLVISLLPELVNWVRDLRYAVCRGCARLRTHWHYQQLPYTDQVILQVNTSIIKFSRPNTSVSTCVFYRSDTAILYNDRAVQENHHVSAAYRLLQEDDEMNILYNLSKDDWRLETCGKPQISWISNLKIKSSS